MREKFQVIDGARVFFFPNISKRYGFFIDPNLLFVLRSTINDFDVVHLHEYRTFQNLIFYYSRRSHVPYVLSPHGELQYNFKQRSDISFLRGLYGHLFGKSLILHADKLLALTKVESLQLTKLGVEKDKIQVVPNGINETDYLDPPPKGRFRKSFGLGEEQIILYLGRISEEKGIDKLVAAFSTMKHKRTLKLVLAGQDHGFLPYLKNMVSDLNLEDKVLFTGSLNRRDVMAAYNDASIVVYATRQEGFGIVALEAGAMGTPVIVSNDPAVDFVREGRFGLSVEYGNLVELKGALEMILEDNALAKKLGENGRKYVLENFSWNLVGKKIESVYDQVARRNN
jgi:glycosyltransferase involved in cell wall biosynthesis